MTLLLSNECEAAERSIRTKNPRYWRLWPALHLLEDGKKWSNSIRLFFDETRIAGYRSLKPASRGLGSRCLLVPIEIRPDIGTLVATYRARELVLKVV